MKFIVLTLITGTLLCALSLSAAAQRKDHLTNEEIELIRDIQDVDLRMKVYAQAIDRRLLVISGIDDLSEKELKQLEKDESKWGKLPEGSKTRMLSDIASILNESIDKFEDVYERDPKNELLPFAFHNIADYCETLVPKLKAFLPTVSTIEEQNAINRALKNCDEILDARDGIPRPTKKRPKTKQN